MTATICYFMLVVVGSKADQRWREHRRVLYAVATVLVLLIGVSRLYLGVHYPSDVVSGFAAGIAWLAASITLLGLANGRNREPAAPLVAPSLTSR
jgi:undecaprenyl-diphosphatase